MIPKDAIQLVTTRDVISELLSLDRHVDLVIPRGSNELVRYVKDHTRIPVLGHADGLCSIYIHEDADPETAVKIVLDAKIGYPAACNSVETLLFDHTILPTTFLAITQALIEKGVTLRCDESSFNFLSSVVPLDGHQENSQARERHSFVHAATDEDFDTEFLDLIVAIKTIIPPSPSYSHPKSHPRSDPFQTVDLAIEHINTHSSHHTDAIITRNAAVAKHFLAQVDSAGVYWNTSTRMADGLRYGFGTEVGISTNKIHARGPVGLEGLMIYKYVVQGTGQVVGDYHDEPGGKKWKHKPLPI